MILFMLIPYTIFIMIYVKYNSDREKYSYDSFDALFAYTNIHHNYDNIIHLNCSYNQLTELPTLPDSLLELHCSNNQLNELPTLSHSLQILSCYGNQLTELPTLPDSLRILYCSNNPDLEYTNEYLKENKKFENVIKECGKLYEPLIKGISL
jgi:Leucine-rich repeat (LRR) protein